MREVVLASGLWMPAAGMALVAARLRRAGFAPRTFAYDGRQPLEANIERFAQFVAASRSDEAPHLVGHSLGGVLAFDTLSAHPEVAVGRVVLLGSPVCGSLAGRRLGRSAVGRWMLGASAPRWREREAAWQRREALGVIAGTLPLGLGQLLGRLPGENDGVVCVAETTVAGMADRALVRHGHSMLAFSGETALLVQRFLATGRFA